MSGALKILVVGSGGREHALAWKIAQSPQVETLFVAPGNAGTASIAQNVNIDVADVAALTQFAAENRVDLAVIGPEVPLALGLVDSLQNVNIRAFGPTAAAARIEASKAFSKKLMRDLDIPTADYAEFNDYDTALTYVKALNKPVVVKADGLAAGKGVIMCPTPEDAVSALKQIMVDEAFGDAGQTVIIEEWLEGPELSLMAFCDGKTVVLMPAARDHKRAFDHDEGPNTGGMGAFARPADVRPELLALVKEVIIQPVIDGLAAQGTYYVGVLYAGLILTADGPKTLEFNCRFGDPETQVVLPLLETDLVEIMLACTYGNLDQLDVDWKTGTCATVVMASPGYPGSYPKGLAISCVEAANAAEDTVVFHAGTAHNDSGQLVTSGGRVLAVSALGDDLDQALEQAYAGVKAITFEGSHYRTDIGRGD